jgi:hypothetical protein
MGGTDEVCGSLFFYVDLEERIPPRHPLRKIRQVVNDAPARLDAEFEVLYRRDPMGCSDTAVIRHLLRTLEGQTEISSPTARNRLRRSASSAGMRHYQAKARRMLGLVSRNPEGRSTAGCQYPASRGHASRPTSRDRNEEHNTSSGMPDKTLTASTMGRKVSNYQRRVEQCKIF